MLLEVSDLKIEVIKKDIKNMHLSVYPPNGRIRLAAPKNLDNEAIRLFVVDKLNWIRRQQREFQNQRREPVKEYVSGESHYFDGRRYLLKVIERYGKHELKIKNKTKLELYVRPGTKVENRKKVFDEFYRSYLKTILPEMIAVWEKTTQEKVESWNIRAMHTKWASCNIEERSLLFNLELAKKPRHCIDYIILHEILHLKERHHNEKFRALLDLNMPNWRSRKRELDELPVVVVS